MDDAEKAILIEEFAKSLESDLLGRYGPVMTGDELLRALGYPSREAFRQSLVRNTVAIPLFDLEYRRGKYALVKDVARHLTEQRFSAKFGVSLNHEQGGDSR
ncbi:hypothetical protein SAMN05216600_1272 [Pseudomonas cuatrocienegasensis]|uniref:Pyocin activator protein PrtN n=1 Tax=Pseudomonas cuatrocienegasensis TaxID=543360 RepID=A0ABY1BQM9_9PSED|nr:MULTISPECIES: hypothetical protein [Pseudomonas]OEC33006.1 hypothetical protein A7D25_21325 [Pseudomonas sp. 21C1]SER39242.1 hypothetical protein SAMN05216600_1272 [Pseudomonas cuatrocienegasensis]